ncbi:MAG: tRNA adenosine(34) deaminase TadA [Pseudomonadales bacterium]|nr:tRNA adenosine(34) deaminase TadA [Pseudomonadales bacterium]MCP5346592.1 tRNA adenosine(34) deaminase TadA [Pseudomonadales bacterium]
MTALPQQQPCHEHWMKRAIQLAERATELGEVPIGAVLVAGQEIIGEGFNRPISSADPTAHAEIVAIREAARTLNNYRLPGSVLYVTIEPCTMCVGAIMHARISTLVFGAREPRAGSVVSQRQLAEDTWFNHRIEVIEGIGASECGDLLQTFFRSRRSRSGG